MFLLILLLSIKDTYKTVLLNLFFLMIGLNNRNVSIIIIIIITHATYKNIVGINKFVFYNNFLIFFTFSIVIKYIMLQYSAFNVLIYSQ